MIKRINITKFGSYKNFSWANQMQDDHGNVVEFKRLNILYGRNYSGKTTLSRLIRCLETGALPHRYETPQFEIVAEGGNLSETQIATHSHHVRVFNKDFIDANLSILRNDEGEITPFAIVGQQNHDVQGQINEREERLGDPEVNGLRHDLTQKSQNRQRKSDELRQASDNRSALLSNKANQDIKRNRLYGHSTYNVNRITDDIQWVRDNNLQTFDEAECARHTAILQLTTLARLVPLLGFAGGIDALNEDATQLLTKIIRPTQPIQELLNDALLQSWVKSGIAHHRGKREACGFCGTKLSIDLWTKIDAHFSEESAALEHEIDAVITKVERLQTAADQIQRPVVASFYPDLKNEAEQLSVALSDAIHSYKIELDKILYALRKRKENLFTTIDLVTANGADNQINVCIHDINALMERHNQQAETLAQDQEGSRLALRRNEVTRFIADIDLTGIEARIEALTTEERDLQAEEENLTTQVRAIEGELTTLRLQLRDERKGAEKVNEYLNHYFGHNALSLVAVDQMDGVNVRFEIRRGNQPAYNLSDGECSLVAFCYFIARLEDDSTTGKKLIIYIDDPISSLDSNHVFFVYSLIETLIAVPVTDSTGTKDNRYKQLFISTHNLDFLKFLKRMSKPVAGGKEQFMVTRTENGSVLELMPPYLKQYVTEFHYLFDQIVCCAVEDPAISGHHCFFNFGNNLRKFFEVYLFFKYPWSEDSGDYNRRVEKYFEADLAVEPLANRVTNELSHGGEAFDRSIRPVDYEEIVKLAKFVLKKVRASDAEQYRALLEAVSKPDPLPAT